MIDWGNVVFYGTLLLGGVFRFRFLIKQRQSETTDSNKLRLIGETAFFSAVATALIFEFLPVTVQVRRIVALINLIAAVCSIILSVIAIFRFRKNRNEDGRR